MGVGGQEDMWAIQRYKRMDLMKESEADLVCCGEKMNT